MRTALSIVIGFVHDLAAGFWAATVVAVWVLARRGPGELVAELARAHLHMGLAAIAVVLLTGAGRGFTYVPDVYGPDAERARRRLLVIKHVVLLVVFGLGTWWQWRTVRMLGG